MTDRQAKSNVEWAYWGKRDPMWGVAAWPGKKHDGHEAWQPEEFYQLGRSDWADFLAYWERYGLAPGTALEIGCGAGRLTRPMGGFFHHVEAIDVSQGMLDFAREHCSTGNIRFHQVDGVNIPLEAASIDAAFSTHVFQHLDSANGVRAYFEEIYRVLKPGGSMMIHVPVHLWPCGSGPVLKGIHRLNKWWEAQAARLKRLAMRLRIGKGLMRMHSYEPEWLCGVLSSLGFSSIEILIVPTRSNGALHPFVMARKPGVEQEPPVADA